MFATTVTELLWHWMDSVCIITVHYWHIVRAVCCVVAKRPQTHQMKCNQFGLRLAAGISRLRVNEKRNKKTCRFQERERKERCWSNPNIPPFYVLPHPLHEQLVGHLKLPKHTELVSQSTSHAADIIVVVYFYVHMRAHNDGFICKRSPKYPARLEWPTGFNGAVSSPLCLMMAVCVVVGRPRACACLEGFAGAIVEIVCGDAPAAAALSVRVARVARV